MEKQVHILNGDSLDQQFPPLITGKKIIFRECLIEGNVKFSKNFYEGRAKEISNSYKDITEKEYFQKTVPELEKLKEITRDENINLWFEEDLFCQVNMWYVIHQLKSTESPLYMILPTASLEFGYSGMVESDLIVAFTQKMRVEKNEMQLFSQLWQAYADQNIANMSRVVKRLPDHLSFVHSAVEAYAESRPVNGYPGRPKQSLLNIMDELDTHDFGPVFREFSKRESIYGFGDLQVKKLYDEVVAK